MKICITAKGKERESGFDTHFGRCQYFAIYDTQNENISFIENPGPTSAHGAGIAAAQCVIDNGVETVITGKLGPNAFNLISGADIKMIEAEAKTVDEALSNYLNNNYNEIKSAGSSHAGMKR